MSPMAVARSSSGGVAICYVLLVLRTTSYLLTGQDCSTSPLPLLYTYSKQSGALASTFSPLSQWTRSLGHGYKRCAVIPIIGQWTRGITFLALKVTSQVARAVGSRVVTVLDSGAERPRFKSQSRRCQVRVLGKLFTPTVPLFTKQRNR